MVQAALPLPETKKRWCYACQKSVSTPLVSFRGRQVCPACHDKAVRS